MSNEGIINSKRVFIVDNKNVQHLRFLKTHHVNLYDEIILVLDNTSPPICSEDLHYIFSKKLNIKTELTQYNEKNVLNMKLMFMLMESLNKGPIDFFVVSNDKDLALSINYINRLLNVKVRLITDIESKIPLYEATEIATDLHIDI